MVAETRTIREAPHRPYVYLTPDSPQRKDAEIWVPWFAKNEGPGTAYNLVLQDFEQEPPTNVKKNFLKPEEKRVLLGKLRAPADLNRDDVPPARLSYEDMFEHRFLTVWQRGRNKLHRLADPPGSDS